MLALRPFLSFFRPKNEETWTLCTVVLCWNKRHRRLTKNIILRRKKHRICIKFLKTHTHTLSSWHTHTAIEAGAVPYLLRKWSQLKHHTVRYVSKCLGWLKAYVLSVYLIFYWTMFLKHFSQGCTLNPPGIDDPNHPAPDNSIVEIT